MGPGSASGAGSGPLLLADGTSVPHVRIAWTEGDGSRVEYSLDVPLTSTSDRTVLGRNLEVFVALGGSRLERGAGHPDGAIVRVGLFKTDRDLLFFEDIANGSSVEILAQSETSVRGTRVQKLRCDEVEMFDRDVWEAAQLVTRSTDITLDDGRTIEVRGSIECLSTMHRPYGLMHAVVQEAREGGRSLFRWGVVDALEVCADDRPCETCLLRPECKGRAKNRDGSRRAPGGPWMCSAPRPSSMAS